MASRSAQLAIGDGSGRRWTELPKDAPPALLGAQDRERAERVPEGPAAEREEDLHQIWWRRAAPRRRRPWAAKYQAKYPKAVTCLTKDREALLAFYDFPAEHWQHIRTTNPIESVFATVRHRTVRSKGCLSHNTGTDGPLVTAARTWRRLNGYEKLPRVIQGDSPTAFRPTKPKPAPPPDHVVTHFRGDHR